jgi:hypothetical protein
VRATRSSAGSTALGSVGHLGSRIDRSAIEATSKSGVGRRGLPIRPVAWKAQLPSRSVPMSTARSARFSSQSIRSGEGARLRVLPELADAVGTVEVGQHEEVEKLGAARDGGRLDPWNVRLGHVRAIAMTAAGESGLGGCLRKGCP